MVNFIKIKVFFFLVLIILLPMAICFFQVFDLFSFIEKIYEYIYTYVVGWRCFFFLLFHLDEHVELGNFMDPFILFYKQELEEQFEDYVSNNSIIEYEPVFLFFIIIVFVVFYHLRNFYIEAPKNDEFGFLTGIREENLMYDILTEEDLAFFISDHLSFYDNEVISKDLYYPWDMKYENEFNILENFIEEEDRIDNLFFEEDEVIFKADDYLEEDFDELNWFLKNENSFNNNVKDSEISIKNIYNPDEFNFNYFTSIMNNELEEVFNTTYGMNEALLHNEIKENLLIEDADTDFSFLRFGYNNGNNYLRYDFFIFLRYSINYPLMRIINIFLPFFLSNYIFLLRNTNMNLEALSRKFLYLLIGIFIIIRDNLIFFFVLCFLLILIYY